MKDLLTKKVLVVGLKKSGFAAANFLKQIGADVSVTELLIDEDIESKASILRNKGIKVELGKHTYEFIEGHDIAVLSPGIPKNSNLFEMLMKIAIPCISELELGFLYCDIPIVAVTGTNGKTTTTNLLYEVFTRCGAKTIKAGNIGYPLCDVIRTNDYYDLICLEVSSFQLEDIVDFKPHIAILLNITPDHLDRYENMDEYIAAKLAVFKNQDKNDVALVNANLRHLMGDQKVKQIYFSANDQKADIYLQGNNIIFNLDGEKRELDNLKRKYLIGKHNWENILSVLGVALLYKLPMDLVMETINSFKPLEHRLEFVETIDTVNFYNDSKATNVDALNQALGSFDNCKIQLIAGGRNKKGDFSDIRDIIASKVSTIFLIGEASVEIRDALGAVVTCILCTDLEEAVKKAYQSSKRGDIVLFSPGCASFDMFKDYAHRGEFFKQIVRNIKKNNIPHKL